MLRCNLMLLALARIDIGIPTVQPCPKASSPLRSPHPRIRLTGLIGWFPPWEEGEETGTARIRHHTVLGSRFHARFRLMIPGASSCWRVPGDRPRQPADLAFPRAKPARFRGSGMRRLTVLFISLSFLFLLLIFAPWLDRANHALQFPPTLFSIHPKVCSVGSCTDFFSLVWEGTHYVRIQARFRHSPAALPYLSCRVGRRRRYQPR